MKPLSFKATAGLFLTAALLTGCQVAPNGLSDNSQQEIRTAAQQFTNAIRAGDADRVQDVSIVPGDGQNHQLAKAVVNDTVTSRKVLNKLTDRFGYVEKKPTVVASNAWLDRLQSAAAFAPIQRDGDRVLLSFPQTADIYLRHVGGEWKVELIPTLVPESAGQPTINDPVVEYRFGVTHELNEWMLARLNNNEFKSKEEFDKARSNFWVQYLTLAANGKDPHDTLLSTLPDMPTEENPTFAQER